MELSEAIRNPAAVARGLGRRVGRTMRRLTGGRSNRLPTETEFLNEFGDRFGTLGDFLEAAGRDTGRLFVTGIPRHPTAVRFADRHPGNRKRILQAADDARAHRFDLLGSGRRELGTPLPWHVDFKSGYAWDADRHHDDLRSRIAREFGSGRDVKIPWELSRFQHLPSLGQAFWFTGEEAYYHEFRDQVNDWIGANRPGRGVNWTSTMDVAIRAVNWIWAYGFFRPEIIAEPEFASLFLRSLFAHGRFIAGNLENGGPAPNNHYFANLLGLLFLGVLFQGAAEAERWKGLAVAEIEREIGRQTYDDGVHYEASIAYHRLMTEMAITALVLLDRCGVHRPALRDRVRRMIDFVAHYTKPNGLAPQIGDNDDGRLQILGEYDADRRDHRALLAVAGCFFNDEGLLELSDGQWEEAFWIVGPERARGAARRSGGGNVRVTSRVYTEAGIAVLRDRDLYAILDAGPVGLNGLGGHAHNDTLSIEIQAMGEDLIVDPGTGSYTADLRLRDRFRSTASHNTVRVDGAEINPLPPRPFAMTPRDEPSISRFVSRRGFDLVEARHHGYMRLADPVLHRRVLLMNKKTRRFVIEDILEGCGRHRLEWFFHLAPGCEAFIEPGSGAVRCRIGEVAFGIEPTAVPDGARGYVERADHSPGYGRVVPSRVVRFEWSGELPVTTRFAISPGSSAPPGRTTDTGTIG